MPAIGANGRAFVPSKAPAPKPVARVVLPNPDHQVYHAPAPVYHAPVRVVLPNPDHQVYHAPPPPRAPARVVQPNPDHQIIHAPKQSQQRGVGAAVSSAPKAYAKQVAQENLNAAKTRQLIQRDHQPINLPKPTAPSGGFSRGGVPLGAIQGYNAAHGIDPVGEFLGNAFRGVVHVPVAMAQGVSSAVGAAYKSGQMMASEKGSPLDRLGNVGHDLSPIAQTGSAMVQGWEPVKITEDAFKNGLGHALHQLGHDAYTDPVGTGLQVIPALGAPGRLAGAAARTGLLGERAAQAASMAREVPTAAGGAIDLTHSGSYSPNIFMKGAQKGIERSPTLTAARDQLKAGGIPTLQAAVRGFKAAAKGSRRDARANFVDQYRAVPALNAINQHADWFHSATNARMQTNMEHLMAKDHPMGQAVQRGMDALKGDKHATNNVGHSLVGNVVPHSERISPVTGLPMTPKEQLTQLHAQMDDSLARHAQGVPQADGSTLSRDQATQLQKSRGDLAGLLNSPNFDTHYANMLEAHGHLAPVIHQIDRMNTHAGVFDQAQVDRRSVMRYALQQMLGVRMATKDDLTPGALQHIEAVKAERIATKGVTDAQKEAARWAGLRGKGPILSPEDRLATTTDKRASRAENTLQQKIAVERTRINAKGMDPNSPLHRTVAARIDALQSQAVHLREVATQAARDAHQIRTERKAQAYEDLNTANKTLGDATRTRQALEHDGHKGATFDGLIHPNEAHNPNDTISAPMRQLSTEEILQHIAAHGNPDTAYVRELSPAAEAATQASVPQGGSAIGQAQRFTGANNGAWDASAHGVLDSMHSSLYRIQRARNFHDFINHAGVEHGLTPAQVAERVDYWKHEHGIDVTPVTEHGKGLTQDQINAIHANQGHSGSSEDYAHALLDSHLANPEAMNKDARVSLVPSQSLAREKAHLKVDAQNGVFSKANRVFRNAVLPISPKWVTGNYLEMKMRNALSGNGPGDAAFAKRVLDPSAIGADAAHDIHAMTGTQGYRNVGQYAHEQAQEHLGPQGNIAWIRSYSPWKAYKGMIYKANSDMERRGEMATLGGHFHQQIQDFKTSMDTAGKSMDEYVNMLREGLTGPNALKMQEKATRNINDTLGKYQGYSPAMRNYVKTAAPFMPWYLNSIKFIYHTLPAHHPMSTAALYAMAHAYNTVGNPDALGLAKNFGTTFGGSTFGSLVTGTKTGPNDYTDFNRYLPTGAFNNGILGAVDSPALPFVVPPFLASVGLNPFDAPLKTPDYGAVKAGDDNAWLSAGQQVAGTFLNPYQRIANILIGQGRTANQIGFGYKPGSSQGSPSLINGINRVLNPLRPTYLRPSSGNATSSGSSWGGGAGGAGWGSGGTVWK